MESHKQYKVLITRFGNQIVFQNYLVWSAVVNYRGIENKMVPILLPPPPKKKKHLAQTLVLVV